MLALATLAFTAVQGDPPPGVSYFPHGVFDPKDKEGNAVRHSKAAAAFKVLSAAGYEMEIQPDGSGWVKNMNQ